MNLIPLGGCALRSLDDLGPPSAVHNVGTSQKPALPQTPQQSLALPPGSLFEPDPPPSIAAPVPDVVKEAQTSTGLAASSEMAPSLLVDPAVPQLGKGNSWVFAISDGGLDARRGDGKYCSVSLPAKAQKVVSGASYTMACNDGLPAQIVILSNSTAEVTYASQREAAKVWP